MAFCAGRGIDASALLSAPSFVSAQPVPAAAPAVPAPSSAAPASGALEKELRYVRSYSIKSAGADIERFQFNTAISRAMELLNALYKYDADAPAPEKDAALFVGSFLDLLRLIAPFAPHFAEEVWESLGLPYSIFAAGGWPRYEEADLVRDVVEMAVQVNGTVRFRVAVAQEADNAAIEAQVRQDARLAQFLAAAGKDGGAADIVKVIVVRGRLINIVAK
ncbi:MAG: class I tRNA ligase family protein [Clostridiales bacterium]|nr:class I tRNA ligase family protein [Clostridiales bacterium]